MATHTALLFMAAAASTFLADQHGACTSIASAL
jgi:hypothetical protein